MTSPTSPTLRELILQITEDREPYPLAAIKRELAQRSEQPVSDSQITRAMKALATSGQLDRPARGVYQQPAAVSPARAGRSVAPTPTVGRPPAGAPVNARKTEVGAAAKTKGSKEVGRELGAGQLHHSRLPKSSRQKNAVAQTSDTDSSDRDRPRTPVPAPSLPKPTAVCSSAAPRKSATDAPASAAVVPASRRVPGPDPAPAIPPGPAPETITAETGKRSSAPLLTAAAVTSPVIEPTAAIGKFAPTQVPTPAPAPAPPVVPAVPADAKPTQPLRSAAIPAAREAKTNPNQPKESLRDTIDVPDPIANMGAAKVAVPEWASMRAERFTKPPSEPGKHHFNELVSYLVPVLWATLTGIVLVCFGDGVGLTVGAIGFALMVIYFSEVARHRRARHGTSDSAGALPKQRSEATSRGKVRAFK